MRLELLLLNSDGDVGVLTIGENLEQILVQIGISYGQRIGFVARGFANVDDVALETNGVFGEREFLQVKELWWTPTFRLFDQLLFENE